MPLSIMIDRKSSQISKTFAPDSSELGAIDVGTLQLKRISGAHGAAISTTSSLPRSIGQVPRAPVLKRGFGRFSVADNCVLEIWQTQQLDLLWPSLVANSLCGGSGTRYDCTQTRDRGSNREFRSSAGWR